MKPEKNILIAFILNILFAIFELIGGAFTNSISIMSDAIHDFGDALSIGIAFILEKVSKRKPNNNYTYGYARFSILGALITVVILTIGSIYILATSILRVINPEPINYSGMLIFAIIGVTVNTVSIFFTKGGKSINQKAINLHMLEDVLGWALVLIGSILMYFTDITIIDPIMSIVISIFILYHAIKHLKEILDLFLVKAPENISIEDITSKVRNIDGVIDVHHIHIWSMDTTSNYLTMHVVTDTKETKKLKSVIKSEMEKLNIKHTTIEIEMKDEKCEERECK